MSVMSDTAERQPDLPRVGRYYADYSELTPEEIAQPDPEAEVLFKRSKPFVVWHPCTTV